MRYLYAPPHCLKFLTGKTLCWQIPTREKKIFLTFDDGPTPGVTEQVLEILQQFQARATFFVLGKNARENPGLIENILSHGHAIGSHGWDHLNGWKTPLKTYLANAESFPLPLEMPLYRPPYGRITPAQAWQMKKRGYTIVMWSVLSRDYEPRLNRQKAFQQIISLTRDGSILLFHDSLKAASNCLAILPELMGHFSAKGFSFESLSLAPAFLASGQQNNDIFVPPKRF
ncbi:MAG: polysaccharide deacetylase family protein [Bacteroidales bacterium]|nr:polysaccharide deacetylase family protein [Bacteroidales bacterium]